MVHVFLVACILSAKCGKIFLYCILRGVPEVLFSVMLYNTPFNSPVCRVPTPARALLTILHTILHATLYGYSVICRIVTLLFFCAS